MLITKPNNLLVYSRLLCILNSRNMSKENMPVADNLRTLPDGSAEKHSSAKAGDVGSICGLEGSLREGN